MKAAATKVQTAVRRYLGSERRLNFRAELDLFRQERPQRMRKYNAVDKIQAAWSGYKGRQSFQLMKTAALKLQAAFRCHLQRQRFVCLKAAALKIQTAVRGHRLRQQFLTSRTAAIVVQRLFRIRVCRLRLRRSITAAVTALQASNS
jgi:abnormal spindle-like microcephaly-associated protein